MAKLPDNPNTRLERYLARLAGQDVSIPDTPINRIECYLAYLIENGGGAAAPNAGAHNSIFRGKSLGASFTEAQADAIAAGTFEDIFVGDYWTIGGRLFRIAALDSFYNMGDVPMQYHHAVIVPDVRMYLGAMNSGGGTATGYLGSTMKTTGLDQALTIAREAFGEARVLPYRVNVVSAAGATPTATQWADSYIDIMTEGNVIGRGANGTQSQNGNNVGISAAQFPLFQLCPQYITCRSWYWLRDVVDASYFSCIDGSGAPRGGNPTNANVGVRPYWLVGKAS